MRTNQKDYYKILDIGRDATLSDIKKAFRSKAKEMHPDTGMRDKKSETVLREIITAYQVLSNRRSRREYDRNYTGSEDNKFNYREFLQERKDDLHSQAKLIFFDLLHRNEKEALDLYNDLITKPDFSLEILLGKEDFMDCAYLLSEEFEKKREYVTVYAILFRISVLEEQEQYFKHFMQDVKIKMKDILCKKINGKIETDDHIRYIMQLLPLRIYEKEKPAYLKKIAELYSEIGKKEKARYYFKECLNLKPRLPGLESLRKKLA